jgi:hypothetical protein
MSDIEVEANKSKRPADSAEAAKDSEEEEKRSMRKKPRVDYTEEKKSGEVPKPAKEDEDDDIQVCDIRTNTYKLRKNINCLQLIARVLAHRRKGFPAVRTKKFCVYNTTHWGPVIEYNPV